MSSKLIFHPATPLLSPSPISAQSDSLADRQWIRLAWSEIEPLWVAGLALVIIIPGFEWGSAIIQVFGRGGQRETVEWAVYLSVLVVFPLAVLIVARFIPITFGDSGTKSLKAVLVLFLVAEAAFYAISPSHWLSLVTAAALAVLTVITVRRDFDEVDGAPEAASPIARLVMLVFVALVAWMGCGALESWTDATSWFTSDAWRLAGFIVVLATTLLAFRSPRTDGMSAARSGDRGKPAEHSDLTSRTSRAWRRRVIEAVGVIALVALSFRTNPILELYHWEAYVGPIQGLRQGGWLLWDNPTQYGVLSILLPTLLPGNAWQSFYVFQAVCNIVVALLMFWTLRGVGPSSARSLIAFAVTAATIFFRPRTATLILAGQMTPSGGPVRFLWSFVMLSMIFVYYRRRVSGEAQQEAAPDFVMWGSAIWLASVLWSFEAAIYCSAIWFPALTIYLGQGAVIARRGGVARAVIFGRIVRSLVVPLAVLVILVLAVGTSYRVVLGHSPDWMGYIEYAVLYGGGFHSLPIDPSGSVWLLLVVFLAMSTALVMYLFADATRPAVLPLAGAWGGVWAISSYYVSRSHPANLLSIATFIIFAAGVTLSVLQLEGWKPWHDLIGVAMVPVFAMPVILTVTHPGFLSGITTPQLSYARFTEQIPLMESSLNDLLLRAGAKPSDPVVRIGDGRLVLPAWRPSTAAQPRVVSPYSWLPKQYEIIGTLPANRRRKYIDRLAQHLGLSGWLIHSKKNGISDFAQQIADISRTHLETRRFENSDWIVSWYQLKPSAAH